MTRFPFTSSVTRRAINGFLVAAAVSPLTAPVQAGAPTTTSPLLATRPARRLLISRFGATGSREDETRVVQQAVDAAIRSAPCVLDFQGLTLRLGKVDVSGADGVIFEGAGAVIRPVGQVGGRFDGLRVGDVVFSDFTFEHRAGWNYMPAIKLLIGRSAVISRIRFSGCGFGAHVQAVQSVAFDEITLREIGIYPRPRPLDPSEDGFSPSFEIYGGGLRAAFCDAVTFGDGIDFRNSIPAGGHVSDRTGGPGGCSTLACDNVVFGAGRVVNAPGQGFVATGEWQDQDVVGQLLSGRLEKARRGRKILFRGSRASGCNQEGCTAFGVREVRFENVEAFNNRNADVEVWQSHDVAIAGARVWEDASKNHPLFGYGTLGGTGAVHITESVNVSVQGVECLRSRHGSIAILGSREVAVRDCTIMDYGLDQGPGYLASGIICNAGLYGRAAQDVAIGPGNRFTRRPQPGDKGGDLYAQDPRQNLFAWGNVADGREVSSVNAPQAFRPHAPNGGN